MTANTVPIFTLAPFINSAAVTAANTARDGTGATVTVTTGTTNGRRITRIIIQAIVTTTLGMVRLFIGDGSTIVLWREIPVTAITVSASVAGFTSTIYLPGEAALILPNNYTLKASTHNAEAFNVFAEGGDF